MFLLRKILQDKERHSILSVAYDEITGDHQKVTMKTRSVAREEISLSTRPLVYTTVAFYRESSEIPEEILINEQNTEIV